MSSMTYPSFKNYVAEDAYVYPAANRSDGGEDNSEKNLRTLTDKFAIKSFIVRRPLSKDEPEYFNVTFDSSTNARTINVDRGECSIGGFYLNLRSISADISELDLRIDSLYNIVILCVLDSAGLLSGDGRVVVGPSTGQIVSRGVRLQLLTDDEISTLDSRYPYLMLGQVKTTVDGYFDPSTLVMDITRYSFIDSTTILTQSGVLIEDWVNERIVYEISHLSQLNYYLNEDDESPSSSLKIVPVRDNEGNIISYDVVFVRETTAGNEEKYPSEVSLSVIEQRTRPSEPEKYIEVPDLEDDGPLGSSFNGTSSSIAREDHLHDNRYVHKLKDDKTQIIQTPVQFDRSILVKESVLGNGFNINSDGSASFSNGKFTTDSSGNSKVASLTADGDITAKRVFNAVWNDYAELYRKEIPGEVIEQGTVIAKVRGKDAYAPVTENNRNLVVGVCSDTYGHLLGGANVREEDNLFNFIPVALAGRVPVKVVKGAIINEGDLMVASAVTGRATSCQHRDEQYGIIVGKALESSDGTKDKVLIQVFLG